MRQYIMGCVSCGDLSFNQIPDGRFASEQEAIENFAKCVNLMAVQFNATVKHFSEGSVHYYHIETHDTIHVYIFAFLPAEMHTYYEQREAEYNAKQEAEQTQPDNLFIQSEKLRNFLNNLE